MAESSMFKQAQAALNYLKPHLPEALRTPRVAVICGSGLGGLADTIDSKAKVEFDYRDIPNFPASTVPGHLGKLVFGYLGAETPAVLMVGRAQEIEADTAASFYEGHSIDKVTFPVRLFKLLGVEIMIGTGNEHLLGKHKIQSPTKQLCTVTNASGGLNSEYAVGDVVLINDHIFLAGLAGLHPLRGPNEDEFGVRFPALSDAYDLELRRTAHRAWTKVIRVESKRRIHEGVYAFCAGPRAECRFLRQLGADLVGMSTVPEIIVARHCGLRVLALSLVTNNAVLTPVPRGDDRLLQETERAQLNRIVEEGKANHEEVLKAGSQAAADVQKLVRQVVLDMFPQTIN
ncbi:purine nucleoside phosphorylase, putative [Coccidioides posadasii C735 delta SOWgp]|uniref:purine-nucleoside phosphorylase n=1 Tax=Coccidioides posadasii (strain C735) TaxID=222929 RepID=C5P2F4_COCP7|nr:purine nucleoside phosphorylase, putative [Coccidioides posadasii C735 delta SOWgp]EER29057.1 purine nucleoside phosphorylase, putative [Coccidioides posadasii C735 delta SOWgp]|eukprot:XP_003071202.1 purine nucleoside phosphorylase, putative [Coccidioides posadasii C735 delta SOWgp]